MASDPKVCIYTAYYGGQMSTSPTYPWSPHHSGAHSGPPLGMNLHWNPPLNRPMVPNVKWTLSRARV